MEIYYPVLIPLFLSLISFMTKKEKKKISEIDDIIKIFNKMTKNPNINSFLGIILNELTSLFLITDDFNSTLLNFFIRVVSLHNTYYFYPLIINTLIEKINSVKRDLTSNEKINKTLEILFSRGSEIFKLMNQINREHFIHYLPMIIQNLKRFEIIKYINYENNIQPMIMENSNYNYAKIEEFEKMIISQTCFLNCIVGFNSNLKKIKSIIKRVKN
jgi:hypothetical protein